MPHVPGIRDLNANFMVGESYRIEFPQAVHEGEGGDIRHFTPAGHVDLWPGLPAEIIHKNGDQATILVDRHLMRQTFTVPIAILFPINKVGESG